MYLESLWLTDFRSYSTAEFQPAPSGITVVTGANGSGKTNLVEAIAYLSTLKSMRGAPGEALVRTGAPSAVVRGAVVQGTGRSVTIAASLDAGGGRDRVIVNGNPLRRTADLRESLRVTVFSPDDLALVKGGPSGRRDYLDDLGMALSPRYGGLVDEVAGILRQRGALLRSVPNGGRRGLPDDIAFTLDVWDSRLAEAGEKLVAARVETLGALGPLVADAYRDLAGAGTAPGRLSAEASYECSWSFPGGLAAALAAARDDDVRRAVTTVGPHRDEVLLRVGGLPARSHASQGEQRTLALALRLAGHRLVAYSRDDPPVLLLDDVFSELDRGRGEALLANLPAGQAVLTTAGDVPAGGSVAARFSVEAGAIAPSVEVEVEVEGAWQ